MQCTIEPVYKLLMKATHAQILRLPPALIVWILGDSQFQQRNAATIESVNKLLMQKHACTNTKLTFCIDCVWILSDSQFQQRKYSVQLDQLTSNWIVTTCAQTLRLPSALIVWILGDSQFQQRKCSGQLNQLTSYWCKTMHAQILYLPSVLMMCEFWMIDSFSEDNTAWKVNQVKI